MVAATGFVCVQSRIPPHRAFGDCWEYWYQVESLARHSSPDLRPSDRSAVDAVAAELGLEPSPVIPHAYVATQDDRWYGVHFWAYALSAVPARLVLGEVGGSILTSLRVTNAVWLVIGVGFALFGSRAPVRERSALVGLATIGPTIWYVGWNGAELFSWTFVLVAVVAYRDGRYSLAAFTAAMAAIQNPPAGLFAGAAVIAAFLVGRWRPVTWTMIGTAIGLVPYAFYGFHYGQPNLIVGGPEYVGIRNLSWARTWGLATDLNHGLLPFQPGLVLLVIVGTVGLLRRPTPHRLLLLVATAAMALGCQVAHNWNSACEGAQRYLVWLLPAFAAVAVEGLGRRWGRAVAASVGLHVVLLVVHQVNGVRDSAHLSHTPIADWVLNHCPWLYWPEHEVFVERTNNADGWPYRPARLPIGFVRPQDGFVSKLLVDPATVSRVGERYHVEPFYAAELVRLATSERGLFYVHPPPAAVRYRAP